VKGSQSEESGIVRMMQKRDLSWRFNHNFYGFNPSAFPIDELDQRIIELLLENSRMSNTEIAKAVDVNESTVRRRIELLIQNDIICGFTVCLNNPNVESGVRAYIYAKVDTPSLDEIVEVLCDSENSLSVYRIVGPYDVVCEMVFNSMNDLHKFYDDLFKKSAVHDIMAHIVVNCYKGLPLIIK
jgi:Lrp/AsnC family transcriptional regulator for asnA, asnC and gidA